MRNKLIKLLLVLFLLFSILILIHNFTSPTPQQIVNVNVTSSVKLDINKCTKEDLDTIPGIGSIKSQEIIQYRETHGNYKSMNELDSVKGIGAKTLEELKSYAEVK